MSERKAYKDWFDLTAAEALAKQIQDAHPEFDTKQFIAQATKSINELEFHERVSQFSKALHATLPQDFREAVAILTKSLPEPLPNCESVSDGWLQWPIGRFIADYGTGHYEESLEAMIAMTQRLSAEFAVRPLARLHQERLMEDLLKLSSHSSPHIRRWCSEGVRPKLPWGGNLNALIKNPSPLIPILENLKDDEELYVRRSVANNLNDIAKDHPALVIKICKRWMKKASTERKWIIKHGLRTLIKDGHQEALSVIGFKKINDIVVNLSLTPEQISIGEKITLNLTLKNTSKYPQQLLIDYIIHFVRKNEKTSAKVFKWKTITLEGSQTLKLQKNHCIRQTTVRALYPGTHAIEVQINGQRFGKEVFALNL